MKYVNLTEHDVNLYLESGVFTFKPEREVCRVDVKNKLVANHDGVLIMSVEYGEVQNLPEPEADVLFIVSGLARAACPNRFDLVSPGDLVRKDGKVIGCRHFVCNTQF